MNSLDRLTTYYQLGPNNLARVALYRLRLKAAGSAPKRSHATILGPFYRRSPEPPPAGAEPRLVSNSELTYFGKHKFAHDGVPDWHRNPFNGQHADVNAHWSAIGDFDPAVGDIKAIWEASRFDWAIATAQHAALGDTEQLDRLNAWLADWCARNPPYRGANWKCGQEASIRVMHLLLCARLLTQCQHPSDALVALIRQHLERIAPTIGYAVAQQNNHGTSEAAALFIGGDFLARQGVRAGHKWHRAGRKWLENRARILIASDGSFSQYSVVYHRLMLDTYAFCEVWRRASDLPPFSNHLVGKLQAATAWLFNLTQPSNGDAPNIGANDGAQIIKLAETDYRDFRPTVQLAAALFCGQRAYRELASYDQPLIWLGIATDMPALTPPASMTCDNGGWHLLHQGSAMAVMRYPRFRFRPSQADALHVDLWIAGRNLLRDAGTYSYNSAPGDAPDLGATAAHNSITFDDRDQMPRLGKFLYGSWLCAENVVPVAVHGGSVHASAAYVDDEHARHDRTIALTSSALTCTDKVSGAAASAILRWRLSGSDWQRNGNIFESSSEGASISIETDGAAASDIALTTGIESRHYLEKSNVMVLEVRINVPSQAVTRVIFAS